MIQLDYFIERLGFGPAETAFFAPLWDELVEHCSDGPSRQISLDFMKRYWQGAWSSDLEARAAEVVRIIAAEPAAAFYADALDYLIMRRTPPVNCAVLPLPEKLFGSNAGVFQMMAVLGAAPRVVESFARLGIPEHYALATQQYLPGASIIYASGHEGNPGFNLKQAYWVRYYIDGRLFRLGRLEYLLHPLPSWVPPVFRRRGDGKLAVLLADGTPIGADRRTAPNGAEVVFTASLRQRDNHIYGTPVTADGIAQIDREVSLDLDEWEAIVTPWEIVPSLHIPSGGGMTLELLAASLREAVEFFPRYLNFSPRIFVCHSWIFSADWEELLPESNMMKFRRELYTVQSPQRASGRDGLFFIFGRDDGEVKSYPADNSVRRAFHELFRNGRPARSGTAFITAADVERFGSAYYLGLYRDPDCFDAPEYHQ